MMIDIHSPALAGHRAPVVRNAEFFRIELASLADGKVSVTLTATTVDDEDPQLLDQEIASDHVATIDELVAVIRAHVHIASRLS